MNSQAVRGLFLTRPVHGGNTADALRALAQAEGFDTPENDLTTQPGPDGWDFVAIHTEMGENLLSCARWRGVLELRKVPKQHVGT